MKTVFALATGRSGTRFLSHLLRHNLSDKEVVCRHEPYFDWGNPSMFGRPIYDHSQGNLEPVRELLARKKRFVERQRTPIYIETSHAFLKSYYDLSAEFFPESLFFHLIRHPLKTARSEANRQLWIESIHFPWRSYRVDGGRRLFNWSLTGEEPIYQRAKLQSPSLFQWYVMQWIEIENRAMKFLDEGQLHDRCVTLHSPGDLNDPQQMKQSIEALGLPLANSQVVIAGKQNKTPGTKTTITSQEEEEFREVVQCLPAEYLEIFGRLPYVEQPWANWLR